MAKRMILMALVVIAIGLSATDAGAHGWFRRHRASNDYRNDRGYSYPASNDYRDDRYLYPNYGNYYPSYSGAVVYQQPVVVRKTRPGLLDAIVWPVNKVAEIVFGRFEINDPNAPVCAPNDAGCRRSVARAEGRFDGQVETADVAEQEGYNEGHTSTAPRKPGEGY